MRIGLITVAVFNALLLTALDVHAVGGGGGGGGIGGGGPPSVSPSPPSPPATGGRYAIGAPPTANSDAINGAYEFRNKMSSDPACQELARQSDSVYTDAKLESDKKQKALEQLRSRAKAASCL